jgi:hypothetical protein
MFNVLVKSQLTLTVSMKNVNTDVCILNFCLLTSLRSVDTNDQSHLDIEFPLGINCGSPPNHGITDIIL